jgi:hypothetical protein
MNFFHPIQLNCWDLLAQRTREQTQFLPVTANNTKRIVLKEKHGLPKVRNLLAHKRKSPQFKPSSVNLHIDSFSGDEINKISIVFPIDNCENTAQFWYDGDYIIQKTTTGPDKIPYLQVISKNIKLLDQVEICNTPMIVRTDLPHSAYSMSDYRLTCTLRFVENIDIETAISRINENN